jgi:hypothetical protein
VNAAHHIVNTILAHATLVALVVIGVLAIVGLPKSKPRYRCIVVVLTLLSLLAAFHWYFTFNVASFFVGEPQWIYLIPLITFAVCVLCGLWESARLSLFRRLFNPPQGGLTKSLETNRR